MKTLFKLTLAAFALSTSAHSKTLAQLNETLCLESGNIAGIYADALFNKYATEGEIEHQINIIKVVNKTDAKVKRNSHKILKYVSTMELDQKSAKKLVYLKCLAGEYE